MAAIRGRQDVYAGENAVLDSPLESVKRGENGLYRVEYGGKEV